MSRIAEGIGLDIILVDWCSNDSMYQAVLEVLACTLQALKRSLSCLWSRDTQLHRCIIAIASDEVQTTIFGLLGILDDIPLDIVIFLVQSLQVLACYLGIAIHDRATNLADMRIYQTFRNNLIPHSVDITRSNCYNWFHIHLNSNIIFSSN